MTIQQKFLLILGCVIASVAAAATYVDIYTGQIFLGYSGTTYAKQWVDNSGRVSITAMNNGDSSAIALWPTQGTRPTVDSLGEITLNRYLWSDSAIERFNISAMNDNATESAAYRFGVEKGGTGIYRPVIFCFEAYTPTQAFCPLKIDSTGVYVNSVVGQAVWKQVAFVP